MQDDMSITNWLNVTGHNSISPGAVPLFARASSLVWEHNIHDGVDQPYYARRSMEDTQLFVTTVRVMMLSMIIARRMNLSSFSFCV